MVSPPNLPHQPLGPDSDNRGRVHLHGRSCTDLRDSGRHLHLIVDLELQAADSVNRANGFHLMSHLDKHDDKHTPCINVCTVAEWIAYQLVCIA